MNKLFLVTMMLLTSFSFSQEQLPKGWDAITLDGKVAYMNTITGQTTYDRPKAAVKKPTVAREIDPSIFHKVKPGETFFSISKKYGIAIDDLYKYNAQLTPETLKSGQSIIVGIDKSKEGKVVYEVVEDMYTNRSNNNEHFVKKGETLYSISRKHGLTVQRLKELNSLKSNTIEIGQKLILK